MPLNKHHCCEEVRALCINHKCSKTQHLIESGSVLNQYFHDGTFVATKSYKICSVLNFRMKNKYKDRLPVSVNKTKVIDPVIKEDEEAIDLTIPKQRKSKIEFFSTQINDLLTKKWYQK